MTTRLFYHDSPEYRELTVGQVRDALERGGFKPKRDANGFRSICPAHHGADGPNFTVHPKNGGGVLMHCHSRNCTYEDVLRALDLWQDHDSQPIESNRHEPITSSYRVEGDTTYYQYLDETGTVLYENVRLPGKKFRQRHVNPQGEFVWGLGDLKQIPYGVPELGDPRYQHLVVHLCEGEKDTNRLRVEGLLAASIASGAMRDEILALFDGRHIVIHEDNDKTGREKSAKLIEWLSPVAATIRVRRYTELPEKGDVSDWWDAGGTLADFHRILATLKPLEMSSPEPEWQEPIPLDDPTGPPFDTNTLPGRLGEFVQATSETLQTPPDVPAIMALATTSASAGGRYLVSVEQRKWNEPVHIHAFVSQPPGSRKSPTERALTWPVTEYENEVNPGERQALANWESLERVKKKALTEAEGRAGRAADDGKITNTEALRMAAVEDLSSHQESKPRLTRIRIDDATAEAAISLAADNGGAIGVLSAESAILDRLALNPYDSPNLEPLLKGHAGDSLKVDRKNRPAETIERFCMTVGVMVQPSLIPKLGAVPGFIDRGAAARFLPSFPVDVVGTRRIDTTPVPDHLEYEYGETIKRILRRVPPIKNGCYVPWTITLDNAAFLRFEEYRNWHEPQLRPLGAYGDLREWAAKLPGQILRIAGLLHIYQHNEPETVPLSLDTLNRAIIIGEYFAAHAEIMYRMMAHETGHETARTVWSALVEHGELSVNRSQLQQRLRGRRAFKRAADLDGPLAVLEEYGYIRIRKESSEGRGRPAEWIDLNPLAMQAERKSAPVVRFTSPTAQEFAPTGTEGFVPRIVGEI